MTVVGEYARISEDDERDPQHGKGIARQQADTATVLRLRGWESGGRYVDDDLSAFKITVTRPEFERMILDLETGKIDGIVGYDVDRTFRQPSDLERVLRIYDSRPGLVFATVQGGIDLSTSDGRTMARVLVAFANKASMDTSRRVSRQKLERAMNGDSTSNYRAFGWNDDGTLHEVEGPLLRKIVDQVFAGIKLTSVAARLNMQGVQTVRGNIWHSSALRRILSAPRIAGFVQYRGELLLIDGQPVKGLWTPLLPEQEWRAIHDIVNPRKGMPRERRRQYLLSGIARCGFCGMGMIGGTKQGRPHRYMCRSVDSGGCAQISIKGPELDEQIRDLVVGYTKGKTIEVADEPWTGQKRLDAVTRQIAELMHQYRSEQLSGSIVFPEVKKLEDEQRQLQSERGRYTRAQKKAVSIPGEWKDWDIAERRAFIQSVLEAVVIKPGGQGGWGYRPERAIPVWIEEPSESEPTEPVSVEEQVQAVS